jgi:hypothetical protein
VEHMSGKPYQPGYIFDKVYSLVRERMVKQLLLSCLVEAVSWQQANSFLPLDGRHATSNAWFGQLLKRTGEVLGEWQSFKREQVNAGFSPLISLRRC